MRIAYLVNLYPSVSHSFIRREIYALEALGCDVDRFSIRRPSLRNLPDEADRDEAGKTFYLLDGNIIKLLGGLVVMSILRPGTAMKAWRVAFRRAEWAAKAIIRRLAYLAEAAALARQLEARKVVHLHAHFGTNSATVARLAGIFTRLPFSFTVHGPDEFDRPVSLDLNGKVEDSAFCVAISSYGRSQLMRWSNVETWSKIHVVGCGVDDLYLGPPTDAPETEVPQFCAVARLSPQKGIPLLVQAAAIVKQRGRSFRLLLVGDGELRATIEKQIQKFELADCVTITGWASSAQVADHLKQSHTLVLPSFAEGLPVVIMEALALERPVIVSTIAGTPELVDAACGWLIPAGSVDALVAAMIDALDTSPERLRMMGKVGRKRVLDRHDARQNAAKLLGLFYQSNGQSR